MRQYNVTEIKRFGAQQILVIFAINQNHPNVTIRKILKIPELERKTN